MPPKLKDKAYWKMRLKNNESARRSREKKRLTENELMRKVIELSNENFMLRAQLIAIEGQFGVRGDDAITTQQIIAMVPTVEKIMQQQTTAKRSKKSLQQSAPPPAVVVNSQTDVSSWTCDPGPSSNAAEKDGHPERYRHDHGHQQQQLQQQRPEGAAHCPGNDFGATHRLPSAADSTLGLGGGAA